jgi:acyl carrier protein
MTKSVLEILTEIRPEAKFKKSDNFIEDGYLDSLDVIILVSELEKHFNISISGENITAENFLNLLTITALIEQLAQE